LYDIGRVLYNFVKMLVSFGIYILVRLI